MCYEYETAQNHLLFISSELWAFLGRHQIYGGLDCLKPASFNFKIILIWYIFVYMLTNILTTLSYKGLGSVIKKENKLLLLFSKDALH